MTRLQRFGWGVAGYMGNMIAMNIIVGMSNLLAMGYEESIPALAGMTYLIGVVIALCAGYALINSFEYKPTRTGATVAFCLCVLQIVAALSVFFMGGTYD